MRQPSSIVAIAALALVSACGRDATGPKKPNNGTMTARIDGAAWSAASIAIDSVAPSILFIIGTNATHRLGIGIPLGPGLGTQTVGSTTPVVGLLGAGSQSWAASRTQGGAGSITLTTVEPGHVAGTFEFSMATNPATSPERQVTSGRFDVKY